MRKLTKFEFFCLRLLWKLPLWNLHLILKCSLAPSLSLHLGSGLNISQLNGGSHWVHAVFLLLCMCHQVPCNWWPLYCNYH